ncbi:MAG: sce7726 family protein [Lachnospiraceae bacterium]|nr:sce7726 family protein [Lachnospiraceae bacterium]
MSEKDDGILRDADIREPLFDYLEEKYGKIRILEEKVTGRARADVVMVTPGLIYGIEIKSDADSYARLEKQVKYYNWYYDRNILVVGSKHAAHAAEHVPEWWGIYSVEAVGEKTDIYELREASVNPRVKDHRKITILWRAELNRLLKLNKLPVYHSRNKEAAGKRLLDNVPGELLWPQVCEELFQRDYSIYV